MADEEQRLLGIFTDGDLRRSLQQARAAIARLPPALPRRAVTLGARPRLPPVSDASQTQRPQPSALANRASARFLPRSAAPPGATSWPCGWRR